MSVNTVAEIMAGLGLSGWPKGCRQATTRKGRARWRALELGQTQVPRTGAASKWHGDGIEIVTDEGELYLASVLDPGTRRMVEFGLSEHHEADLVYGAMQMASAVRGGADAVAGVIFHTTRQRVHQPQAAGLASVADPGVRWAVAGR